MAAETISYTYDARGRVTQVVRTGTVNNNVQTTYQYDKANNRRNAATTGSTGPSDPPPSCDTPVDSVLAPLFDIVYSLPGGPGPEPVLPCP